MSKKRKQGNKKRMLAIPFIMALNESKFWGFASFRTKNTDKNSIQQLGAKL